MSRKGEEKEEEGEGEEEGEAGKERMEEKDEVIMTCLQPWCCSPDIDSSGTSVKAFWGEVDIISQETEFSYNCN